ncbi:MAG TPA: tetratricopeptide repeat protein [Candidatus Peribacteraceae bacterium]|nr:tetratricopeptide repeat protein [Candidatus Peribacteraceae bacterium]
MQDLPRLPQRFTLLWIILGFFVAAIAVYGEAVAKNLFVAWDDNYLIVTSALIKGFSWQHTVNAFTSFDPELYVPLTTLTYQLAYTIGGGVVPPVFHGINLLLHTLNALCVGWLLLLLTKRRWIGLVGGLLFLLHPLNVEATAWAAALKDVLSTLFFLLSLIAYMHWQARIADDTGTLRPMRSWLYIASLLLFVLGLLSKVMVLTLPVVLLMIDVLQNRKWTVAMFVEKIPYFIFSIIFGCVALFGKTDTTLESTTLEKILMAAKSTVTYLQNLLWPANLSVLYPYDKAIVLSSPDFFIPIILVLLLLAAAVLLFKKFRILSFGIAFYVLTLIPTFFNFAKGGYAYFASDRYAYVPEIGIFIVILVLIDRALEHRKEFERSVVFAAFGMLLCVYGFLSYAQAKTWRDTQTLFLHTLSIYPHATTARINLGYVYREIGQYDKALTQFNAVLSYEPDNALAYANIGAVYEEQGRTDDAVAMFQKGMAANPRMQDSFYALGLLYEKQGRLDDAISLYKQVNAISPNFPDAYDTLGSAYMKKNDVADAQAAYKKTLSLNPYNVDAHYNLGVIAEKQNDLATAAHEFEMTLQLEGDKVDTLTALAGVYAQQNDVPHTVNVLRRILDIDPQNAFANQLLTAMKQKGLLGK